MNTSTRKVRTWAVSLTAAVVFGIVNPAVIGCGDAESDESDWGYTAEDMEAAVVGEYVGQVEGKNVSIRVSRPKAAVPNAASPNLDVLKERTLQCGSRSFVRPAGACIASTSLDIDAEVTSEASVLATGKVQGSFMVLSRSSVDSGILNFSSPDNRFLGADFAYGAVTRWYVRSADGPEVELPLTRVP